MCQRGAPVLKRTEYESGYAQRCTRCGGRIESTNCVSCSWPYHIDGWINCRRPKWKITLDVNCVNALRGIAELNELESLHAKDLVVLERSDEFMRELTAGPRQVQKGQEITPHPKAFVLGGSALGDLGVVLAGGPVDAEVLRKIMFPTTAPAQLTKQQRADIQHLLYHVERGRDFFVTRDCAGFIADGRQCALSRTGLWVFDPPGMLAHLRWLSEIHEPTR